MHIIAGLYRHKHLFTPKGEKTRPTASRLRESLFNICQGYIEGTRFLDLFSGSGAIGLEALSRGAHFAMFVDSSKEAIRCVQQNIAQLNVQAQSQVLYGNVFQILKVLEEKKQKFDIIFADPPYQTLFHPDYSLLYSEKVIQCIDETGLLAPQGVLFIEEAFESEPQMNELKILKLKNSRRVGGAILQQYIFK
jgi:16S rRNA (guanine966-N2)-methyltransferase